MESCYLKWKWVVSSNLLLIYLKHSEEQKSHFIRSWYLKWKEVDRVRTLYFLGLNWTADISWYSWSKILSSNWSVSLKLCSVWLVDSLKEEFQEWHKQTNTQIDLIACWTATFAVNKDWTGWRAARPWLLHKLIWFFEFLLNCYFRS